MSFKVSSSSPKSEKSKINIDSSYPVHKYSSSQENDYFVPIVFSQNYDIHFFNLENIHPFDCKKWGKIANFVVEFLDQKYGGRSGSRKSKLLKLSKLSKIPVIKFVEPDHMITDDELSLVHTKSFVKKMNSSKIAVISASEVPLLVLLPMFLIRSRLLEPIKWQVSGTILAGYMALKHGYAINIGGGFHHCSAESAGGFCLYADITLCIEYLWCLNSELKILIVDLDAHQGNGYENDWVNMKKDKQERVYIMDMYNASIYPGDVRAKSGISREIILSPYTRDSKYLKLLTFHLEAALEEFQADIIVYNAGTDILEGDPLGCLSITAEGIKNRDEIVFENARRRKIPIVMVTSGGYQMNNATIIGESLKNLFEKNIISITMN